MSTPTTGVGWIPEDTFAARLLLARRHLNISVKEAAERCHLHYATWSTWERGSTPQNYPEIVLRVAEGLGVDRDWLAWGGPLPATPLTVGGTSVTFKYQANGTFGIARTNGHRMHGSVVHHMGSEFSGTRLKVLDRHHSVTNLCRMVSV